MSSCVSESAASQLALEWRGGATERRFAQARPNLDAMPWDSFDLAAFAPDDPGLREAREVWTNGVFTEYASAAAFSSLSVAMLQAQAPVDLAAVAADFAVDELAHVTLVARLVMAMGGATPFVTDLSQLAPTPIADSPRLRAAELAVKISCVGEALSLPALSAWHRGAGHPLVRAVLDRLRHDEGPHAAIGHWYLELVASSFTVGEREFLGKIASDAVRVYQPLWQGAAGERLIAGKHGPERYAAYMQRAVDERIAAKLARHAISVDRDVVSLV